MGTSRNPWRISRANIDGPPPAHSGISGDSTPAPCGIIGTRISGTSASAPNGIIGTSISGTSTPDPSKVSGTSAGPPCGISGTSAAPPYGGLYRPRLGNIRKFTSPNFRKSDELNADFDRKFSNDPIVPPLSTQVFGEKLPNFPNRDIYTRCRLNLATESVNLVAPQFVNHGLYAVSV